MFSFLLVFYASSTPVEKQDTLLTSSERIRKKPKGKSKGRKFTRTRCPLVPVEEFKCFPKNGKLECKTVIVYRPKCIYEF